MLLLLVTLLIGCDTTPDVQATRQMACDQGNMDQCFAIGESALNRAIPDIRTARAMFSKGCNVHHPASCNALAKLVREAKGGPPDPKRAADLFRIACTGNVTEACVELGVALYDGWGVDPEPERAVELFTSACEGSPPNHKACSALGVAWSLGKGVPKRDLVLAEEFHARACDGNYAPGCVHAGTHHHEKRTGNRTENQTRAVEYLEKACRLDAHFGCFELAQLHETKKIPNPSDIEAARFYQRTCNQDPTRGCFEAARLMEAGRVSASEGEIESLYNVACEHGNAVACTRRSL